MLNGIYLNPDNADEEILELYNNSGEEYESSILFIISNTIISKINRSNAA